MSHFISTNGIHLHYLDRAGEDPPILIMHGLSANAHFFDGLAASRLPNRLIAVDLRGRGRSDKPATGYRMADHAADIIGLMDGLGLDRVVMAGHSYGGLLTCYLAAHFPDRLTHCIVMDSGFMHPSVKELIKPSLDRLGQVTPSWAAYREAIKAAPYWQGYWDTAVESYYRADVRTNEDGTVQARSRPENIAEAVDTGLDEPWEAIFAQVSHPTLMLHAPGSYGPPGAPAVIPLEKAQETVAALPNCIYRAVPGNHMTMMFGQNVEVLAGEITAFLSVLLE